ncbi:hypothetical protein Tco_1492364 [Tanacetum coccineum]
MNELNELRDQAYENSLIYKEKTKKIHDSKIKNRVFNVGDRVLLFNSRLKIFSGKLKTRWTRPFTISQVFPYVTVELSQTDRPNFKDCLDFEDSRARAMLAIPNTSIGGWDVAHDPRDEIDGYEAVWIEGTRLEDGGASQALDPSAHGYK